MDKNEILKLSPSERILLAQEIWDSIPEKSIGITDPIKKELDRRLESHRKKDMLYFTPDEIRNKLAEDNE